MTNYYSNKSDFSSGSGTGTTSNYYGASYSIDGETQLTNLLTAIDEVAQVVKSEGLSHLYVQTGDASLGKDMPSSTFSTAYDRADSMLTSAKRIHSEVLERLDGKFTKGVDNSLKSLNEVNGSEKPYQSKNLTYQKMNTMYDEMGNAYDYQTTEHYSLADILDHKASPVKAAQEIYQNRLENLRDKLTEANGLSAEEVKKYKGMSDEELMSQFYISGQIGNYSSLKHFQWQEDNKEWLEPVEQWLGIGLLAVSIVASVVSWGAASPTVVAAATAVATTTATAGTVYSVVDGGYSAITGNTLVSGTALDTDDRLWAAAEAITAAGTMGVGRVFKAAGAADDTIKVATKAADTVDDATNLVHIGYNTIIHGEDPTLALVSFAGGKVVSGVNKHIEESRAKSNGDSGGGNPAYQEYVERKILEGKSYLSEPDWAQKVATIESNTSTYSNFKASQLEVFKSQATDVESNITIETRNTAGDVQRVQVKAIGFDEAGNVRIQDYTTATGGLSVSRQALLEDLSKYGGTVVGKGKGAFTGGTEIKPGTQIDVVSQKTDNLTIGYDPISNFRSEMEKLPHIDLSQNVVDGLISTPNGKRPSVERVYSQEEIATHLAMFEDGIVKVQSYEGYQMSAKMYGGTVGAEQGHYVMPKWVYKKAVQASNGNPRILEELLGLDEGYLGNNPVVIDINHYEGLRMPSGNEPGAFQGLWEPGGYTKGGIPEAVIDQLGPNDYEVSKIFSREGV